VLCGWGEGLESVLVVGVVTWYVLEELWVFVPGGRGGWAALCNWVGSSGRGLYGRKGEYRVCDEGSVLSGSRLVDVWAACTSYSAGAGRSSVYAIIYVGMG